MWGWTQAGWIIVVTSRWGWGSEPDLELRKVNGKVSTFLSMKLVLEGRVNLVNIIVLK